MELLTFYRVRLEKCLADVRDSNPDFTDIELENAMGKKGNLLEDEDLQMLHRSWDELHQAELTSLKEALCNHQTSTFMERVNQEGSHVR